MTEAALVSRVLKRLSSFGGYWNKNHGSVYVRSGRPDLEGCLEGLYVAIEAKAPGVVVEKGLSQTQRRHIQQIRDNGGIAIASNDEDEIMELLEARLRKS